MERSYTIQGEKEVSTDSPELGSGPADPLKMRDAWVEFVRPAADRGKLDKVPTQRARTPRERAIAQNQAYWLSKKSFGAFHDNYDLIDWSK